MNFEQKNVFLESESVLLAFKLMGKGFIFESLKGRHDTQRNDNQHNDTQQKGLISDTHHK